MWRCKLCQPPDERAPPEIHVSTDDPMGRLAALNRHLSKVHPTACLLKQFDFRRQAELFQDLGPQ